MGYIFRVKVGSSSILVKNSYLDINKKNRNDQEPGTILTGIITEKGFINKNVSLKKIITKNDEEPNITGIGGTMAPDYPQPTKNNFPFALLL